jgi:formylglycine-generating enzyme required for sulfatase activity
LTSPAQSNVFLNNVAVGQSRPDGWLLLEGIQSGNHQLRVKHEGFQDWEQNLTCDGSPLQVIAELKKAVEAIPKPSMTMPVVNLPSESVSQNTPSNLPYQTIPPKQETIQQNVSPQTPPKKSVFSPLVLAVIGISGLLLLTAIGVGGAFMLGMLGGKEVGNVKTPTPAPTIQATPPQAKAEMVEIPGGNFTMGRSDGDAFEKPEHEVEVKSFAIDKTEVTNEEYYSFIQSGEYKNIPSDWENGKPLAGKEKVPVRYINVEDANAFAQWRSKRDGVTYRLPTEEEWEYVARNGVKATLYPWGNEYKEECAVVGKSTAAAEPAGSKPCGENDWKVQDLIGNVWEWTSSEAKPYQGNAGEMKLKAGETYYIVRGGSAYRDQKGKTSETSTYRLPVPSIARDNRIGFRLVRSD